MTTCHLISIAKKMNKLKGKVDLMKKPILHLKGMVD
jgi:hypothetical protein